MRFHVITLFPDMIETAASHGVVGQAFKDGRLELTTLSPRAFTSNVHQTVDDRPFGGGDGMVMMAEPLEAALNHVKESIAQKNRQGDHSISSEALPPRVIHLSPRGTLFTDAMARELARDGRDLVLIASRYAGIDQRFLNEHVDDEISIGDYVLSGGELGALVVIDAVARLLPGVLGNQASSEDESFAQGLLEYPQFTRPREWNGQAVPAGLLSGHHGQITLLKRSLSLLVTAERRPELLEAAIQSGQVSRKDVVQALELLTSLDASDLRSFGLPQESAPQAAPRVQSFLEAIVARLPQEPSRRRRRKSPSSGGRE